MPVGQGAPALAERRAHDVDDDWLSHVIASSGSSNCARTGPVPTRRPRCARGRRLLAAFHERLHRRAGAGRLALVGDAPVVEHDGPVGQLQRPVDLLLDHDQRGAVAIDLPQPLVHGVDHDRRQAQGELVGHEHLGRHHQDLGQRQQALLPTRQRAPHLAPALAEDREGRVGPLEVVLELAPPVPLAEGQRQVLLDREAREDAPALHHVGHAEPGDLVGGQCGDVLPGEDDLARRRGHEPRDRPGDGRLAGAVRADQGHDAAARAPGRTRRRGRGTGRTPR